MNIEEIISFEQLSGDQRELAESIGIKAYKKFVEDYGGSHIYVCKADTVIPELRNSKIYSQFNGFNYRELAKKYNLSPKTIREIIAEKIQNH